MTPRRRVVPARRWLATATLLAVPAVSALLPAADAHQPDVTLERQWSPYVQPTSVTTSRLALDVAGRTAWVLSHDSTQGRDTVQAWDLDRLTPKSAPYVEPSAGLYATTPLLVDETHHTLVLAPTPASQTAVPQVEVLGLRDGAVRRIGAVPTRFPAGYSVLGLSLDAARARVFAIAEPAFGSLGKTLGAGTGAVQLDEWSLPALAEGTVSSPLLQPLQVPARCGQVISTYNAATVLASADGKRAYFGCASSRDQTTTNGPNAWDVNAVAELDLAAAAQGTPTSLFLRPVPGNFNRGDTVAIPRQHRLVLVTTGAGQTSIKVFDAEHGYLVGNVGINANVVAAVGFDAERGTGYYVTAEGLGVFDAASTPATQGVVYGYGAELGVLQRPIEVDPKTRRLFVASADNTRDGLAPFVVVFRDRTPPAAPDVIPEVGLDVPEQPGVTDSARSSSASALGAEFRWVGGPNTFVANASHLDSRGLVTKPGTRWERFAVVDGAGLTSDEAAVGPVVTAVQDGSTTADLANASLAAGLACADFGFTPKSSPPGTAHVWCDLGKQRVEGAVATEPARVLMAAPPGVPAAPVPVPVQVRQASSSVALHRDALGPLTSTVRAEADGVDILGVVQFGRVVATATTTLHGRSGTAATTYTRSVTGVVVNGMPLCASDCPLDQVRDAVDAAFGGRVRVEFPDPATTASPNGTVASVVDDPYRHAERRDYDDLPDDDVSTPAMEVIAYTDGAGPSRLLVTLASVTADTRYSIFRTADEPGPVPTVAPPAVVPVQQRVTTTGPATATTTSRPTTLGQPRTRVTGVPSAGTLLRNGLRVVFRSPGRVAAVAALWSLLALPAYLAARRRLLLELPYLRRSGDAT